MNHENLNRPRPPATFRVVAVTVCALVAGGLGTWSVASASGPVTRPNSAPPAVPTNAPVVNATTSPEMDRVVVDARPVQLEALPLDGVGARGERPASALVGRPVVLVKTASWCPPCGGDAALEPIESAAAAEPGTQFVVVLHSEPSQRAAALAANVKAPNIRVVSGDHAWGAGVLPADFGSTIPALVRLSTDHAVTRVSVGAPAVAAALAQRSVTGGVATSR